MDSFSSPIPVSEIESVLTWVDTYKLSRQTKKINRDFSDAVLLAEILSVHYPKMVEMHNYPPRNSHTLKLNNWLTLNRKVLKRLKLNLCSSTMEQLANNAPGVIERVLIMVRDKIQRDEEMNRSLKDAEQNVSSGGSYYEACGDDENVLLVPLKTRVNGMLETVQQKVVSHESYLVMKEELKDVKEIVDVLKQKVEHLDILLKLKDERIEDLQKQLDRKQSRRKCDVEYLQNNLSIPLDSSAPPTSVEETTVFPVKIASTKVLEATKIPRLEDSKIPLPKVELVKTASKQSTEVKKEDECAIASSIEEGNFDNEDVKTDDFKSEEGDSKDCQDLDEFKDSEGDVLTIPLTLNNENALNNGIAPMGLATEFTAIQSNI